MGEGGRSGVDHGGVIPVGGVGLGGERGRCLIRELGGALPKCQSDEV